MLTSGSMATLLKGSQMRQESQAIRCCEQTGVSPKYLAEKRKGKMITQLCKNTVKATALDTRANSWLLLKLYVLSTHSHSPIA